MTWLYISVLGSYCVNLSESDFVPMALYVDFMNDGITGIDRVMEANLK